MDDSGDDQQIIELPAPADLAVTGPPPTPGLPPAVRPHDPAGAPARGARPELLTSLAVLVAEAPERAEPVIDAVMTWAPPELRLEVVSGDEADLPRLVRPGGDGAGPILRRFVTPVGDRRVDRLSSLMAVAEAEVVLVPPRVPPGATLADLARVTEGLADLWVTGADVVVVPLAGGRRSADLDEDPGLRLARALGLTSGDPGSVVVLRRWTARWLFEGLASSLEPVRELCDRAADLGVGLIELLDG